MRHVREVVGRPRPVFVDRTDAGSQLSDYLQVNGRSVDVVVAVPSGGVPLGRRLAERTQAALGIVLVRKLPLPAAPEMGFGAVTLEGDVVVNDHIESAYGISAQQRQRVVERVLESLRARRRQLEPARRRVAVQGRDVVLVDDGLATGVTMEAAVREMRRKGAGSVSVAVPASPISTLDRLEPQVDDLFCLLAQDGGGFAVASYYQEWYDMSDEEVRDILQEFHQEGGAT